MESGMSDRQSDTTGTSTEGHAEAGVRDLEHDAKSKRAIFEEARDRLNINIECEDENRTAGKADLEFREGAQWDKQPYTTAEAMNQPEITVNLTDALVRRVVNNMKQQRPRGKAHPVGDGADIHKAAIINGIGRHVEYRSLNALAYDVGGEMAVTMGVGYWRLIAEYVAPNSFKKDMRIVPIRNTFCVYMDPSAEMPDGSDAMWCIISTLMKRTEYKRLYPRAPNISWHDTGKSDDREWENREEIRLAEYFRIREEPAKLFHLRGPDGKEFSRYEDELPDDEGLAATKTEIIDERDSSKRVVEWFRLGGTTVLEEQTYPGTWIPVIRCEGNAVDVDGKIKRRGMVRTMQDPARMVNYGNTAKIKRLGLTPQAPWIAAEGQLEGHPEWSDTNNTAHPVLTYKPLTVPSALGGEMLLPPPERQPPAQIEAGFSEFVQQMETNLLAVAGMQHDPGMDANGQVVSGRALRQRQKVTDQSHFQYYDNQTLAIAHTWRIMVQWVKWVYPEPGRIQRIIGEDGTPDLMKLNEPVIDPNTKAITEIKNDISVGEYDIVMDTGPGYETKREEGSETLISLLGVQPLAALVAQVGADLVFRSLDHPYMQELADRITAQTPEGLKKLMEEMPAQAKSVIQALANENGKLKQALQAAQSGITKAHIGAVTKAHDTETRAATQKQIEELRAGMQVFIEGMKHGHETQMAERDAQALVTQGESNG
jgi:Phage P22-like portal protein